MLVPACVINTQAPATHTWSPSDELEPRDERDVCLNDGDSTAPSRLPGFVCLDENGMTPAVDAAQPMLFDCAGPTSTRFLKNVAWLVCIA